MQTRILGTTMPVLEVLLDPERERFFRERRALVDDRERSR